ncbi:MAG: hypothetical protein IPJ19_20715 [Planctomycetes bacterium]|nr:hypothetical protein [Planctomycetota bacterium]
MRRWTLGLLLLVTALSLALRLGAISRLLPVIPEPDASSVWTYREMCGEPIGEELHKLHYGVYPLLPPWVLAALLDHAALLPAAQDAPLAEHLQAASAAYLHLRWLFGILSALLVPVVYGVARRLWTEGWALLCAALVAFALLHVAHSSVAKAHAADATFVWLTIWLSLRICAAPSLALVASSTLSTACAIGMMQTGFFAVPPMFVAALFASRANSARATRVAAWLAPFAAIAGGLCFVPGGVHVGANGVTMGGHGHTILFHNLDGRGLATWIRMFWEHDPVLAVLAGLGLFALLAGLRAAWKDLAARASWLVIGAFALPYLTVISLDELVADRYLLPVYPLFALLATLALRTLLARVADVRLQVLAALAVLALPAWVALHYTWIGRQPSTLEQLARFVETRPGAESAKFLLSPALAPPLFPTQDSLARQIATSTGRSQPWFYYLAKLARVPASAPAYALETMPKQLFVRTPSAGEVQAYFDEQKPDWIVMEVSARVLAFPGARAVLEVLRAQGQRLLVLSGEHGEHPGEVPIDYQAARDLERRVLAANALGPQLEIYRWPAH